MLVFRLYMDAHRAEAMREKTVDARFMTDGITVEDFSIDGKVIAWNDPANPMAQYNVPGSTILALPLATPIPPKSRVRIRMRWHYDLVADKGWKEGAIDETTYFLATSSRASPRWDAASTFNNAGVGDYTWFFRSWFFSYSYMDLAVDGVRSAGADRP